MVPPPSRNRRANRIVAAAAAAALSAILGGGALLLRDIASVPPAPEPATAAEAAPDLPPGRIGKKAPSAFGLPVYPGAYSFASLEADGGAGSAAFLVKGGTAEEVARFYVQQLGEAGWVFDWQRGATDRPGGPGRSLTLAGTRVRWQSADGARQLTLVALDDPRRGYPAHAALSWSPRARAGRD